jgi:hypothetical protein
LSPRALLGAAALLLLPARQVVAASDPKSGEEVVFFPTLGWRVPGGWETELHGCIFELESRAVLAPLLRHALGIEDSELSADERARFRERTRLFLVDHQSGRAATVRFTMPALESGTVTLGPSSGDGQVRGRLTIKDSDLAQLRFTNQVLRYALAQSPAGGTLSSTGEVHLVSEIGLSVISDIDDTIKISQVLDRGQLLRNTFCRPFQPVPGMAAVYEAWARTNEAAFHYVSASPWQLYRPLAEFVRDHGFPAGTFHLRDFRIRDGSFLAALLSPEHYKPGVIRPLLERFPQRRFVLVGDSGEKDPEIYGALARQFPDQIAGIWIRDVTGETPAAPRYQQAFTNVPPTRWRVFKEPTEITRPTP